MELLVEPKVRLLIVSISALFFILDGIIPIAKSSKSNSINKVYNLIRYSLRIIIGMMIGIVGFIHYFHWSSSLKQAVLIVGGGSILVLAGVEFLYWLSRKRN